MGIIRKTMSIGTVGLVDFRSDKERTAAYTKGARKHARRQAHQAKKQTHLMQQAVHQQQQLPTAPVGPPPGWYQDPNGQPVLRWWDGTRWTEHSYAAPATP